MCHDPSRSSNDEFSFSYDSEIYSSQDCEISLRVSRSREYQLFFSPGKTAVFLDKRELARTMQIAELTMDTHGQPRSPFFGRFPERGIWTALGLSRAQFFSILVGSIVLFVMIGGPIWSHLRESHFSRITVSYAVIPVAVAWALYRNGAARPLLIVVASAVLSLVKLVVTAGLLVLIALART